MDIKAYVEKVFNKLKSDSSVLAEFKKDPLATVKKLLKSAKLPDDVLKKVVDGVKAKLAGDKVASTVSGVGDAIGGLFGK